MVRLVAVFILAKTLEHEAALTYMNDHNKKYGSRSFQHTFTKEEVDGWTAAAHAHARYQAALLNNDEHVALTAYKHIAEYNTYVFVKKQNMKGVGVPSKEVVQRYLANLPDTVKGGKMVRHLASIAKPKKEFRWLQLFRRKWSVDYKRLIPRAHVALDHKQKQVKTGLPFFSMPCFVFGGYRRKSVYAGRVLFP